MTIPLRRRLGALLLFVCLVLGLGAPSVRADGTVESYVVTATVTDSGLLEVEAVITPGADVGDIVQRFATELPLSSREVYRFTIENVSAVTADGADAGAQVSTDGAYTVVTIPAVAEPVTLSYSVRGAALDTDGSTTVGWRYLQGLNVGVTMFEAQVAGPGPFTMIACNAGPPANPGTCQWYQGGTHEQSIPVFRDGPRGPGEVVQAIVRYPAGVVAPNTEVDTRWTLEHAFSTTPLPLALALGIGILGAAALALVHRRFGQDAAGVGIEPTVVGTFRPAGDGISEFAVTEGVRPGEVGTLLDQRVDPVDVAATVIDLAVHGSLLIRELPRSGEFARTDWQFERRADARELRPYETTLLGVLAPPGESHRLSEIGPAIAEAHDQLQSELYNTVVEQGWFAQRPDQTRNAWTVGSRIALAVSAVLTVALIAVTPFGLLGLVLLALSLGAGQVGQAMPARTARGSSVLSGLGILRGQLLTQATDTMPPGREIAELSEVLPYAVVLGGTERWLDGLSATDDDEDADSTDLPWYHGPDNWHLSDLPDSLRNFVTTLEGTLVER
ncbi:MAG: DUF2207 family protein [Propioniciclava sp.]